MKPFFLPGDRHPSSPREILLSFSEIPPLFPFCGDEGAFSFSPFIHDDGKTLFFPIQGSPPGQKLVADLCPSSRPSRSWQSPTFFSSPLSSFEGGPLFSPQALKERRPFPSPFPSLLTNYRGGVYLLPSSFSLSTGLSINCLKTETACDLLFVFLFLFRSLFPFLLVPGLRVEHAILFFLFSRKG